MNKKQPCIGIGIVLVSLLVILAVIFGLTKTDYLNNDSAIVGPENGKSDVSKRHEPQTAPVKESLDVVTNEFLDKEMRSHAAVKTFRNDERARENQEILMDSDQDQRLINKTLENLKKKNEPQVIYGKVTLDDINNMKGKKPDIVANSTDLSFTTKSAIIDGEYCLGIMPPGKYDFFLEEIKVIPGGMYHDIEIKPGQSAQEFDFTFNDSSIVIKLLDEKGNPYSSPEVKLLFGGTDMSLFHNFKTLRGVREGVIRIDHINNGPYFLKIEGDDFEAISGHTIVSDGENNLTIKMKEDRKGYVF